MEFQTITPMSIKETSAGYFCCDLLDDMLKRREVECIGAINAASAFSLCRQLRYLQQQDPEQEITMFINSLGGEVDSGLALYDVMQAVTCPIRTVCMGTAASMGAVLFAAGDKREILPHGKIMIHDPMIYEALGGSALHVQTISRNLMKTRTIVGEILAEHTGRSLEEIYQKTASDTWFYAEEAVAFGLADCVINKI